MWSNGINYDDNLPLNCTVLLSNTCHYITLYSIVLSCNAPNRVGYGNICPGDNIQIEGRFFILFISFCGLGMFCGPVMNLASSWKERFPGGTIILASFTLVVGVIIFTYVEGMSHSEAIYFSVVTGTTIGYGKIKVQTDLGKLVVAAYAILVINVMSALLDPARDYLENLCRMPTAGKLKTETPEQTATTKKDQ